MINSMGLRVELSNSESAQWRAEVCVHSVSLLPNLVTL